MRCFPWRLLEVVAILLFFALSTRVASAQGQQPPAKGGQPIDSPGRILPADVSSVTVKTEEIEQLPKGRTFQSISLLAPSVNSGEIEGGWQINGASGAENAFVVDGVSTASPINGASRQNIFFEYLAEVHIKTGEFEAEDRGALGGVISTIVKSGSNRFAGETHYHVGGSLLNAKPVKRLVLNPADDATVGSVQDDEPRE